jgi:hypothetical protein
MPFTTTQEEANSHHHPPPTQQHTRTEEEKDADGARPFSALLSRRDRFYSLPP